LLVISGLSIYAVNDTNAKYDDPEDQPDEGVPEEEQEAKHPPVGIKKINDMGVFSITATFSILAYIWMFIALLDQEVAMYEAWLTLALFFVLIGFAFGADKYKAYTSD